MVRIELSLRLPNSPGALESICQLLSAERVNVLAMSLTPAGALHLVTDNPTRASSALRARHHKVTERDVVFVACRGAAGSLAPVLGLLTAAGININYAYAAQGENGGASVVVGVDDAQRVAAVTGL